MSSEGNSWIQRFQNHFIAPRRQALAVAVIVLAILSLSWVGASIWQKGRLLAYQRTRVTNELTPYTNALSTAIDRRLIVLKGLKAITQAHSHAFESEQEEFQVVAEGLYANTSGIRSMVVAPDGIIQFIYPTFSGAYGGMDILGQNLLKDPQWNIAADAARAIETGQFILSAPHSVDQPGDATIVALEAVYDQESGAFWGLVAMALDMQPILDEAGFSLDQMSLAVALKDDSGRVFYGQAGLFENDPVVMSIALPGGSWQLCGEPAGGWENAIREPLVIFQVSGLVIVGLVTVLVYMVVSRQGQLAFLIQQRTLEVTTINQSLQNDIAERIQQESDLRESQEQYQRLFASMLDGYALHEIICDDAGKPIDYRILDVNPAWERFTGLRKVDVIGKTVLEVLPRLEPHWIDTFGKVALTGEAARFENFAENLGNKWFECVAFSPEKNQFAVAFLDVTARKQAEQERLELLTQLREQADKVQHIIDTVPQGVLLIDSLKQVVLANPVAVKDLEVLAKAKLGDTLSHLGDRPIDELLTSPPRGFWHDVETESNIARNFEVIARAIETGPANAGWVLVLRDVTRERELQTRIHLQERLAAVGQLAAGIAHDFNNIMATIILRIELVLKKLDIAPESEAYLITIREQALRASTLINQILDFSRQSVMERQPLDLVPFLKEQVQLFERTLPENIKINLGYDQGGYTVNADLTRMQQIIMNLAVNARDAMPEGGELTIILDRVSFGETTPSGIETGEWIQLNITDTGDGIPEEALPHIFEPFFTTKAPGEGTGLGLAQVYGIVKQHDGHINVHTLVDEGTTFTIYLPAVATHRPTAGDPRLLEPLAHGNGETILVVEDHQATRAAVVDSLILLNYKVLTALDGQEALAIWREHKEEIALIFSDVVMPRMGGIALFHALQKQDRPPKMVLLSGHPLDNEMESLRDQGLQDWLLKPIDLEQIAQMVSRALTNG